MGNIIQCNVSLIQRFLNHNINQFQMFAGGNLRHNTAITAMNFNLSRNHIRKNFMPVFDNCYSCFIAAGFHC